LEVAVARRGARESAPAELGQEVGIFRKHGIVLDLLYHMGSSETEQSVISGRRSSPIQTFNEIAGKTIGYAINGSCTDCTARRHGGNLVMGPILEKERFD
jgi:ABC-type nitrate/sulfonate/bicarbonate transport system substrate-binding protein